MDTAVGLPLFGYLHFQPCVVDYPMTNTPAQIALGRRELLMKIRAPNGETKEGTFKVREEIGPKRIGPSAVLQMCLFQVTKMRCWRVMSVAAGRDDDLILGGGNGNGGVTSNKLELSFEYLMNDQELQWITVVSPQAILMSLCLQTMVEELLRMRSGGRIKRVWL